MSDNAETEKNENIEDLLLNAGMTESESKELLDKGLKERTEALISKYDSGMTGKPLASLLKAVKLYGEPGKVSDFLCDIINGPPVAGQLIALRIAEKPEWRKFENIDMALKLYQADFDSLTQAFSYYQDHYLCGCEKRACMPRI